MRTIRVFQYNVASGLDSKITNKKLFESSFGFLEPWSFASRLPSIVKVIKQAEADIFMLQGLTSFKDGADSFEATDKLRVALEEVGCQVASFKPNSEAQDLIIAFKKDQFKCDKDPYNLPNIKSNEVMICEITDVATSSPLLFYNIRSSHKENLAVDLNKLLEHIKINVALVPVLKIILAGDFGGDITAVEDSNLSALALAKCGLENESIAYIKYPFEFSHSGWCNITNSGYDETFDTKEINDADKLDLLKDLFLKEEELVGFRTDFLYHYGFSDDDKSPIIEVAEQLPKSNIEDLLISGEHDPLTPSPHIPLITHLEFFDGPA